MKGRKMMMLNIPDMSCGHCKAAVEAAIAAVDPAAKVAVDLVSRQAQVETGATAEALIAALGQVGFPTALA
ncbi:MAG: copper chaperone [Pseudorhodobacter sp.]